MVANLIFIALVLMAASIEARNLILTVRNGSGSTVYVILPWEMCGLTSSPANQAGVWNSGWNVGTVYTVYPVSTSNITLNFALTSKSSHIMRMSTTYAGAQANDNSLPCTGFPITVDVAAPSDITVSNDYAGCSVTIVSP